MITVEQSVIAALLIEPQYFPEAMKAVEASDFGDMRLGDIYSRMLTMRERGQGIDAMTVGLQLQEWGIRGIEAHDLHAWTSEVFTGANVGFYAEQVAREASARDLLAVAVKLRDDAEGDPGEAIRAAKEGLEAVEQKQVVDEGKLLGFNELISMPVEHDWLISGLIERQDRLMLTGVEGFGKTALLRQFVFAAAAGIHPFRDYQQMPPKRVLVIDAENTERQWTRNLRNLAERIPDAQAHASVDHHFAAKMIPRGDITKPRDLAKLHKYIDRHKPDIVMIGPLYRLVPGSITNDDDAAPVLTALDTIRDRGIALLIEAHAGKSDNGKGARNLAPRGSSALLGWPEFGLGLQPARGKPLEAELVPWRGNREERLWPHRLVKASTGLPWQIPDEGNWNR